MAESEPKDMQAQLGVAQGFVAADEPAHASGFADRAVALAEEKGDAKALGAALTVGAVAYQKAGDPETAFARAKRALEIDPGNKAAMAVFQMTKGRSGAAGTGGAAAGATPSPATAGTAAPLPQVTARTSGSGRSSFAAPGKDAPAAAGAPDAAAPTFVGPGMEKALKLTAEAGRKWALDKAAALLLLDEAVAADARNAAARAARARARLEMGDAAGALEDADVALAAGPSAAMHAVKGEALLALGRKGEEVLAELKAAAELDGDYSARYQQMIASGGQATRPGASAPDPSRRMGEKADGRPSWLLPAVGAGLAVLAALAWLLLGRRRDED